MKKIPANDWHLEKGAKMKPFAGFSMPLSYGSIIKEHLSVRENVGLFDLSHMGQIRITGLDAARWLNTVTANNVSYLHPGKAQYSLLLNRKGGVLDDIIVYMIAPDDYLLVVNAANIEKDYQWLISLVKGSVKVKNESDSYCLLAVSGPKSHKVLENIFKEEELPSVPFHFDMARSYSKEAIISMTGYTGEETFEIFISPDNVIELLNRLYKEGKKYNLRLCGLGCRDSLRIEAALPLYGNELTEQRTPYQSDVGKVVKIKKSSFIGKRALSKKSKMIPDRKIGYFIAEEKKIPRKGYGVFYKDKLIGKVTSGTYSPVLKKPIFMAFVENSFTEPGSNVFVEIRDKKISAYAVEKPFLTFTSKI